ncbi:hypothetical protein CROQUDRAFT_101027 [Cronartium quercuum f. sp. fusiforme G11]|uniref:Uncharacterized protein n=1 Tax=Cronartium quercuum f. sp. fusiforme G11 TaxID=708437 RepID=A0A9P6T5W6_9BASI|nr:hypothetical protein CROQUDRAFT_101027 [Cronartium quercuum f. sp. fusiforme G11]
MLQILYGFSSWRFGLLECHKIFPRFRQPLHPGQTADVSAAALRGRNRAGTVASAATYCNSGSFTCTLSASPTAPRELLVLGMRRYVKYGHAEVDTQQVDVEPPLPPAPEIGSRRCHSRAPSGPGPGATTPPP